MINGFLIIFLIAAIAWIAIFFDWLGRRKGRRSRDRTARARPPAGHVT